MPKSGARWWMYVVAVVFILTFMFNARQEFWGPANGGWVPESSLFKVARVLPGGPMDKAGIQSGDVLEAADGYPLNGAGVAGSFWPFTQRLLVESWTPARPLHSEATWASHSPDQIDEYAFVVVLQIGQVVGEVGEVVAHAGFQVLANMTIDRGQRAAAPLIYIR